MTLYSESLHTTLSHCKVANRDSGFQTERTMAWAREKATPTETWVHTRTLLLNQVTCTLSSESLHTTLVSRYPLPRCQPHLRVPDIGGQHQLNMGPHSHVDFQPGHMYADAESLHTTMIPTATLPTAPQGSRYWWTTPTEHGATLTC